MIDEYLSEGRLRRQGLFDPDGVRSLIEEDRKGIRDHAHLIYGLLTMQVWLEVFDVL